MTILDGLMLATLLLSGLISLIRGLIREVLSLLAYIVAIAGCVWAGGWVVEALASIITIPLVRAAVGYGGLFVVLMLLMSLINALIVKGVHAAGLADVDRGLGGLFGMTRGMLLILLFVMVARVTPLVNHSAWRDSLFVPMAESGLQRLRPWLPGGLAEFIR